MGPVYAAVDRVISRHVFMAAFRSLRCSVVLFGLRRRWKRLAIGPWMETKRWHCRADLNASCLALVVDWVFPRAGGVD
ncbi:hypothetical protein LPU83_pLPU83d_0552 (plasmid) [Rhizobium favelukesii]|uniref:Uncharacterized protein n=1 Tax=Rhizobium favelukesii TaxID=348824 RepID=W6RT46_9HYPH|nr:hypothetical protein LPU83_pLPU83d_0552 [Rhizobium favelukesii]